MLLCLVAKVRLDLKAEDIKNQTLFKNALKGDTGAAIFIRTLLYSCAVHANVVTIGVGTPPLN